MKAKKIMAGTLAAAMTVGGGALPLSSIATVMTASAAATLEETKAAEKAIADAKAVLEKENFNYTTVIGASYFKTGEVQTSALTAAVTAALSKEGHEVTGKDNITVSDAKYVPASKDGAAKVTYTIKYSKAAADGKGNAEAEAGDVATNLELTAEQSVDAALTLINPTIDGFVPSNKDNDQTVTDAINKAIAYTGAKLFGKVECDYVAAQKGVDGSIKTKSDFSIYAGTGAGVVTKNASLNLTIAKLLTDSEEVIKAAEKITTEFAKYSNATAAFKSTDTDATIAAMVQDWVKDYNVTVTMSTPGSGRNSSYVAATTDKEGSFAGTFLVSSKSSNNQKEVKITEFVIAKLKSNQDKVNDIKKVLDEEFNIAYTLPNSATKANVDTFIKAVVETAVGHAVGDVTLKASDLDGVSYVWNNDGNYSEVPASFLKEGEISGNLNIKCGDATATVEIAKGSNKIKIANSAKENVEAVKTLADKAIKNVDLAKTTYATADALKDALKKAIKSQKISDDEKETKTVADGNVTFEFKDVQFTAASKTAVKDGKFTAKLAFKGPKTGFTNFAGKYEYNDADYTDEVLVNLVIPVSFDTKKAIAETALEKLKNEYPASNRTTLDEIIAAANDAVKATGFTIQAAGTMTSEDASYSGDGSKTVTVNIVNGNTLVGQKVLTFNIPKWDDTKTALEKATNAVNAKLASLAVTNTTTTSEVVNVIKQTIAPYEGVGIDPTSIDLKITEATKTAKGSITGTVKLTTPDATLTSVINVNVAIPVLAMTDAEKLDAAAKLLDETLAKFEAKNGTAQADVEKAIADALAKSDNLKDVISSTVAYKTVDATKDAEGSITATFELKVNETKAAYNVNLKIAKLDKNDAEKADEIKKAINDAIAAYEKNNTTTLNATKADEFKAMVEKAVTDLGYKLDDKDVKVTISDFKVSPSTVVNMGSIKGSIDIFRGSEIRHIDIHINIKQLPTDAEKLATATGAVKDVLAAVKASNETTADTILDAIKAELVKKDVDVAADWDASAPFTIKKATETEDGLITGSIVLKSGDKSETVAVNLPIAKLVLTDADKAEAAKKVAEEALKNFVATNDTIESDVAAYLTVALKDTTATATIANFNVLKSTVDAEGKVIGTVTFKVGENGSATLELALPIAKIEAPTVPGVVLNTTYTNSTSAIRVKWDAAEGVDGYEVYKNGTLAGTVEAGEFLATGLAAGTTYNFTVKAYKTVDGVKYYSEESAALKACTKPKATTITGFVSRATKTVKVAWHSVTGPTSYQVQISADKTFKKGVKNVYVNYKADRSYTTKVSKSKTTYYVRVRACKRSGGNVYRAAWSPVKTVKTK